MIKEINSRRKGEPRRDGDCTGCNKGQWNLHMKLFLGQGLSVVALILILWGLADANNVKESVQNKDIATLKQMAAEALSYREEERAARTAQTAIIQKIEGYGQSRNIILVQMASKMGIQIDLSKITP